MGRRLGQHFLTDNAILDRIVAAIDPASDDVVLEVGPGQGGLTMRLANRVGRVVAIEKDEALIREARSGKREAWPANVILAHGDALELDWHETVHGSLPASRFPLRAFKVIGNIPYYITSPLIEKALTAPMPSVIVFLIQQEVADRLGAAPGGKVYGALTVGVQAVARVERLFTVKAGSFRPPPKVDSAVVRITPLAEPLVPPEERAAFRGFTVALFGQRRKQLVRSLRETQGIEAAAAQEALRIAGLEPTDRVEVASPAKIVALFRAVSR